VDNGFDGAVSVSGVDGLVDGGNVEDLQARTGANRRTRTSEIRCLDSFYSYLRGPRPHASHSLTGSLTESSGRR
jgi:hypothetical protein